MSKKFLPRACASVFACFLFSSCVVNPTYIKKEYVNPNAKPFQFKKICVVAIVPDDALRQMAENEIVSQIGSDRATASYKFVSREWLQDKDKVRSLIKGDGFDGVIVLRYINTTEETTNLYSSFPTDASTAAWNNYNDGWSTWQEPRVMGTTLVRVETRIYSVTPEELLWSATTDTVDPPTAKSIIDDLVPVVRKQLQKQKLIGEKK